MLKLYIILEFLLACDLGCSLRLKNQVSVGRYYFTIVIFIGCVALHQTLLSHNIHCFFHILFHIERDRHGCTNIWLEYIYNLLFITLPFLGYVRKFRFSNSCQFILLIGWFALLNFFMILCPIQCSLSLYTFGLITMNASGSCGSCVLPKDKAEAFVNYE